ncbi:MAG: FmdB family zinc ribbon protein [Kiritimatiellia bacterium]
MPTYEYECLKCGHSFELFQSMTDEPRKRCPECRGKVRRVLGVGAGILFKGSGFYETDYRSESYKKAAEKDTEKTGGADGGKKESGGKSEPAQKKKTGETKGKKDAQKVQL